MIPTKSSMDILGIILPPNNKPRQPFVDWELGGVAISDPSQGSKVKEWKATYESGSGTVTLEAAGVTPTVVLTKAGMTWMGFCFDQNMRPLIAWTESDKEGYLYWYDSSASDYVTWNFGSNIVSPQLTLDEKADRGSSTNDVILMYIRDSDLNFRVQRERFLTERTWGTGLATGTKIKNFGMSSVFRLQAEVA